MNLLYVCCCSGYTCLVLKEPIEHSEMRAVTIGHWSFDHFVIASGWPLLKHGFLIQISCEEIITLFCQYLHLLRRSLPAIIPCLSYNHHVVSDNGLHMVDNFPFHVTRSSLYSI